MTLKILHAADLHIGLKFTRGYGPDVREKLIEARFDTLKRLVNLANEEKCDLFVIAGDLFDSTRVSKKDTLQVANIINGFEGQVAVLPGNHDYVQTESRGLWDIFSEGIGENALLLFEPKYVEAETTDHKVGLYPGPCISKHSKKNAIEWIKKKKKSEDVDFHIGVAHGSLEGVSPDFDQAYYPMTKDELNSAGIDLWLMGHTHIRIPKKKSGKGGGIFFASTPEPDGFDCQHEGFAWLFEAENRDTIKYRAVRTGHFRFLTMEEEVNTDKDLETIKDSFSKMEEDKLLVKLKVTGRLPRDSYAERSAVWDEIRENVLYLDVDDFDLLQRITREDIDREFTDGSFPHKLLTDLTKEENPLSLQFAYELVNEVRS